jgi:hypothetical protein
VAVVTAMEKARAKKKILGLQADQAISLLGIIAALVIVAIVNVIAARHYKRWDWTESKRYTLTEATKTTLRDLQAPIDIWVLMGSSDPLEQSVKQLLVNYEAESDRLNLHYIDPDRDTLALEDVRKRYKIETGRSEDGHVVADAIVIVASGEKHWFLGPTDMVEVSEDDARAKPREEQAITGAIRNVVGGEKAKLCFTSGHGELLISENSEEGLGFLKNLLEKDNYDAVSVDTSDPNAHEPFKGCSVVVIAGARGAFTKEEEARLKTYLMLGGNLLAALSPINAPSETGMENPGIGDALVPFGIGFDDDLVFETDPHLAIPKSRGVRFFVAAKPHAVTGGLAKNDDDARDRPRVMVNFARSLHHVTAEGSAPAIDLLTTSKDSFGVLSIAGAATWTDTPEKGARDLPGPLTIAMASERPKIAPKDSHGPRVVVIGTGSVMIAANWQEPLPLRGAALVVESAISWLASKPQILDVPAKPSVAAGLRITEEMRSRVRRYVLVLMPLAVILLGLAVGLRRRATEGKARNKRNA